MKLSLIETAQRLGLTPRQLRYRIKSGEVPATKIANRWLIDEADLPQDRQQLRRRREHAAAVEVAIDAAVAKELRGKGKASSVTGLKVFASGLERERGLKRRDRSI